MFSKVLYNATYKNGNPGKLTEEHEQAEHHRFKKDFLFKNKQIPKDLYASRLIQHLLIIKALETQLQNLSEDKSAVSPFFALSYLDALWRTPGIENDLRQLGVNPDKIQENEKAKTTKIYLDDINQFTPKILLAHFLLHVAGFMHGGNIIQSKYIRPSNQLTSYQITTDQYDFSTALSFLPDTEKNSVSGLFQNLMNQVNLIALNEDEYNEILDQCKNIYKSMTGIYDDLCDMHSLQTKQTASSYGFFSFTVVALLLFLKLIANVIDSMTNHISYDSGLSPK